MGNIAGYYGVNGEVLQRDYKDRVSGRKDWGQIVHANQYLIYLENVTSQLSIDGVQLIQIFYSYNHENPSVPQE